MTRTRIDWTADESERFVADIRRMGAGYTRPWARRIAERLADHGDAPRVVDLGCGPGLLAAELARQLDMGELTLVDASETMLRIAAEETEARGLTVRTVQSKAEEIELPDGSADVVICKHLLLHADDLKAVLQQMRRIVAPGGWAFVVDFDPDGPRWLARAIWAVARLWVGRYRASRFWWGYTHGRAAAAMRRDIEQAGFAEVSVHRHGVNYLMVARP